jgi:4-hydroxy-2-oxoglutarate aldolase
VATSSFRANLLDWLSQPIAGIVVAGSTGEAPLLDDDELLGLVETANDVRGDRLLTVGTGAESTHAVIRMSAAAADRGADSVLVRAPSYYRGAMTLRALDGHFRRVADASPVPVILYHIPKFVPVELVPELVGPLMEHENVVGIKDSSGDLDNLKGLVRACGSNGSVLVGSGALLLDALRAGAVGGILGVALIATGLACDVHGAWRAGDDERAEALQARLGPLHQSIVVGCGVPGVKAALDRLGMHGGPPRPPLVAAGPDVVARVGAALAAAGAGPGDGS